MSFAICKKTDESQRVAIKYQQNPVQRNVSHAQCETFLLLFVKGLAQSSHLDTVYIGLFPTCCGYLRSYVFLKMKRLRHSSERKEEKHFQKEKGGTPCLV